MTTPITVLQIIPRLHSGGAELGCLQVAAALVKAGHRALVASEGGRMVAQLEASGARHITLPMAAKNPARLLLNARTLARIICAENVDIIHARSRAPAWSALLAARRTGIGFVTTYHSEYSESGRLKNLYNGVMARSDIVISVSDHMTGLIRARYGTPADRVATIHRAFDPARFDPALVTPERLAAVRALFGLEPRDRYLLLAGRITRRKAQGDLVEAMGLLKAQGVALPVAVFAGEIEKPEYHAEIVARARGLGVEQRLRFPGNVADMPAAYLGADVLLNISAAEGLPRVAIEAQAMGRPVIVSDTGPGREVALTPPDVTLAAATGLRVPHADPEALARTIQTFQALPEEDRRAMGARAAARVRDRYTVDRLTRDTLGVYQTVLERRRRRQV